MSANMYRVGDYVYFETSSTTPYQIRRIEELIKTPTGNVEAKVMCFYRRRDISQSLVSLADKHQIGGCEEENGTIVVAAKEELSEMQKHQIKHRELFLSRQVETLPATHIRGKCNITLLNETELFSSYLNKEDTFFYSLVYDPQQKTLLADKGEMRVGPRFQAEPGPRLNQGESDMRNFVDLEVLLWNPDNPLDERQINTFQIVARSVGTFARSLDCSSTVKQPSLHLSAAAASRDITLLNAMNLLHKRGYSLTRALCDLIPLTGPVLCRDEIEDWSASEVNLFEEALDKYGKDFLEIKNDYLPWKSHKAIVEFYYMWKTTDRYVQQKRIKVAEAESKLKQVYIPNYNKPNPAQINNRPDGRPCEGCLCVQSNQWYIWGPSVLLSRVCSSCWSYWKKYGGLKSSTKFDNSSTPPGSVTNEKSTINNNNLTSTAAGGSMVGGQGTGKTSQLQSGVAGVTGNLTLPNSQTANNNNNNNNNNGGGGNRSPLRCTMPGCAKLEFRNKAHLIQHLSSIHGLPMPQQQQLNLLQSHHPNINQVDQSHRSNNNNNNSQSNRSNSDSPCPVMKTRAAFCLVTTPLTRISRQVCKGILDIRRAARRPFKPININLIKQECQTRLPELLNKLKMLRSRKRVPMDRVSARLGIDVKMDKPNLLLKQQQLNVISNSNYINGGHLSVATNNAKELIVNNSSLVRETTGKIQDGKVFSVNLNVNTVNVNNNNNNGNANSHNVIVNNPRKRTHDSMMNGEAMDNNNTAGVSMADVEISASNVGGTNGNAPSTGSGTTTGGTSTGGITTGNGTTLSNCNATSTGALSLASMGVGANNKQLVNQMTPKMRGASLNRLKNAKNTSAVTIIVGRSRKNNHTCTIIQSSQDLYFIADTIMRKTRKQLPTNELKRAARKPWCSLKNLPSLAPTLYSSNFIPPPTNGRMPLNLETSGGGPIRQQQKSGPSCVLVLD